MTRRMLRVVSSPGCIEDLSAVLTVEEAAVALRIGRGTAYALARQWRETNGPGPSLHRAGPHPARAT